MLINLFTQIEDFRSREGKRSESSLLRGLWLALFCVPLIATGETTQSLADTMTSSVLASEVAIETSVTATTSPDEISTQPALSATAEAEATWRKGVALSRFADDEPEDLTSSPTLFREIESDGNTTQTVQSGAYGRVSRRPEGSLTGRIVFASGGHGWTWHTTTSLWYTQRPLTHGMVEDMGNLDQNSLFVDDVFRAGATVVPLRPVGVQSAERVLDNSSPLVRFQGPWYDSTSTLYFGRSYDSVPYRFAIASLDDSATARFAPTFPKSDIYPVYVWARDGADRVLQTYRVAHAGGVTEVQVDHRMVGRGWVYIGEYYFNRGRGGFVEVTSRVDDPALADGHRVVVADAVRFGNGMGDVNRGGGASGWPREQEPASYWAERAMGQGTAPLFDAVDGAEDQSNNVGTPPRMSAHMNRETSGTFFDRIYHGFHSNASGGRGVVGLFNHDAEFQTDLQVQWAEKVARAINREMTDPGLLTEGMTWTERRKLTDSHINFGEIRRDYLNNEMAATISEVAFHDNAEDARLLRSPKVRMAFARAVYRAVGDFFMEHDPAKPTFVLQPASPRLLAVDVVSSSSVMVRWDAPTTSPLAGGEPRGFRVHHSVDGLAFDGGVEITTGTRVRWDGLVAGESNFFQVSAYNKGGVSRPSGVMGVATPAVEGTSVALLVGGFTVLDESLALNQKADAYLGSIYGRGGALVRVVPRLMNPGNQIAEVGRALAKSGYAFESCAMADYESRKQRSGKPEPSVVFIMTGRQPAGEVQFSTALLERLTKRVQGGGALVVSGTDLVSALDGPTSRSLPESRAFSRVVLGVGLASTDSETLAVKPVEGELLSSATVEIDAGTAPFETNYAADALTAQAGAKPLLSFSSEQADAEKFAAVLYQSPDGGGAVATFGFGLEHVAGDGPRTDLLGSLLKGLGVEPMSQQTMKTAAPGTSSNSKSAPKRAARNGRARGRR
jgi:hypothetical protein